MRAAIIQPDGNTEVTEIPHDLKTLQGIVGGWLEAVYGAHDEHGDPQLIMLINEEGKIHNLSINSKATALWYAMDPMARATGDALRGTVLVVGGADENGDMKNIPDDIANMLTES